MPMLMSEPVILPLHIVVPPDIAGGDNAVRKTAPVNVDIVAVPTILELYDWARLRRPDSAELSCDCCCTQCEHLKSLQ